MLSLVLWQRSDLQPLVIAVAAIALGALLWLYPAQLAWSRRRWKWLLPLLRVAVIAALTISILKPVAARPKPRPKREAVAFLVDQSRSMQITDTGRTPAESMALAQGLGLLPPGRRTSQAANLQVALQNLRVLVDRVARAQSEAEYARLAGRGIEQAHQRLGEATAAFRTEAVNLSERSIQLRDSPDLSRRLAELRRLPPVLDERLLRELRTQLGRMLRDVTTIEARADAAAYHRDPQVRRICDTLSRLSRTGLTSRALFDSDHGLAARLPRGTPLLIYGFSRRIAPRSKSSIDDANATGDQSDILEAVQSLRKQLAGRPVQAIVLVSDGRQVGGDADVEKALAMTGPPVFTVGVASSHDRRDVAITAIKAPDTAFVGETTPVQVDLRASGCQGEHLNLTLNGPGGPQSREIAVGDAIDITAHFNLCFTSAGAVELAAEVTPLPGEATNLNNRAEHWVKVVDQTVPIAIISGSNSRDYNAVCDAISAAPWLTMRSFLVSGDTDTLPLTPDQIRAQEILVLMDVHVWSLSDAQWDAVEQLVAEDGGSVILEVGNPEVLQEYEDHPVVSRLLPFDPIADVSWRIWPGDEPRYSLVEAPWTSPPLGTPQPRWSQLPAVLKYLAMPQLKPNAQAYLIDRDTSAAAAAQTRLGLGRSILLGLDETWRWQGAAKTAGSNHFWKPLVRAVVREPYAVREGDFALDANQIFLKAPAPLHVRARVYQPHSIPTSEELEIDRDGALVATRTMWPAVSGEHGQYETTLDGLPPGQYELRLVTGDDLAPLPRLTVRVVRSSGAELADLSGNNALLKRIAESTGGKFVTLDQLTSLPPRLEEVRERQGSWLEYPLWDSPYLFLFALAGLSMEWTLRKQAGLA